MLTSQSNKIREPTRIVTVEADLLERIIQREEDTAQKLIDAQQQLANKQHGQLLTLQEVCAFTQLSPKTVRQRMADMQVVADGPKVVRFFRSEVMA